MWTPTYEVKVLVKDATPPKGVKAPEWIKYRIRTFNTSEAKAKALTMARQTQTNHPRIYRNANFVCDNDYCELLLNSCYERKYAEEYGLISKVQID
jgi:hypothetical protein